MDDRIAVTKFIERAHAENYIGGRSGIVQRSLRVCGAVTVLNTAPKMSLPISARGLRRCSY